MFTKKQITQTIRWILKTFLILIGFVITVMPFIPAMKEYFLDAPGKEFGTKEVAIMLFGVLMFTGGIYSNAVVAVAKNMLPKKPK